MNSGSQKTIQLGMVMLLHHNGQEPPVSLYLTLPNAIESCPEPGKPTLVLMSDLLFFEGDLNRPPPPKSSTCRRRNPKRWIGDCELSLDIVDSP
ncbi:hypothetical protein AGIG_G8091 [Arapaima gigas]